jgi:hypothetical protein
MPYQPIGSSAAGSLAALAWLLSLATSARAHDPGMSIATLAERGGELAFELEVADADLPEARRANASRCNADGVLALWLDAQPLAVAASCRAGAEPDHTAFVGNFTLERGGQLSVAVPLLHELPRGHETFVRLLDATGQPRAQRMLSGTQREVLAVITVPARPRRAWLLKSLAAAVLAVVVLLAATRDRRSVRAKTGRS